MKQRSKLDVNTSSSDPSQIHHGSPSPPQQKVKINTAENMTIPDTDDNITNAPSAHPVNTSTNIPHHVITTPTNANRTLSKSDALPGTNTTNTKRTGLLLFYILFKIFSPHHERTSHLFPAFTRTHAPTRTHTHYTCPSPLTPQLILYTQCFECFNTNDKTEENNLQTLFLELATNFYYPLCHVGIIHFLSLSKTSKGPCK